VTDESGLKSSTSLWPARPHTKYELRGVERVEVLVINIGVGSPHKLTKYNNDADR